MKTIKLKNSMQMLWCTMMVLGVILMFGSTIYNIGYFIYQCAHDVGIALAAWNAFVLWVTMLMAGIFMAGIGFVKVD